MHSSLAGTSDSMLSVLLTKPSVLLAEPSVLLDNPSVLLAEPSVLLDKPSVLLAKLWNKTQLFSKSTDD